MSIASMLNSDENGALLLAHYNAPITSNFLPSLPLEKLNRIKGVVNKATTAVFEIYNPLILYLLL